MPNREKTVGYEELKIWLINIVFAGFGFLFLLSSYLFFAKVDLASKAGRIEQYCEYSEFVPNNLFQSQTLINTPTSPESIRQDTSAVIAEYMNKWQSGGKLKILYFQNYRWYESDKYRIFTYVNPTSYEIAWEDYSLPLKEGEWFTEDKDEAIVLKGAGVEIGDAVIAEDPSGVEHAIRIVGIAKYPLLYRNDFPLSTSDELLFEKHQEGESGQTILLLNPQSKLNQKSDVIVMFSMLLKTEDPFLKKEIEQYGTLTPVESILNNKTIGIHSEIGIWAVVAIVSVISLITIILKSKDERFYSLLAGYIGGFLLGRIGIWTNTYMWIYVVATFLVLAGIQFIKEKRKNKLTDIRMEASDVEEVSENLYFHEYTEENEEK